MEVPVSIEPQSNVGGEFWGYPKNPSVKWVKNWVQPLTSCTNYTPEN